ncbi:hypothetical protein HYZ78_00210 [Candidatus Microgenomates bacterium]|nr:hypothetical protein [Candidatus Microgenomates bacterium]
MLGIVGSKDAHAQADENPAPTLTEESDEGVAHEVPEGISLPPLETAGAASEGEDLETLVDETEMAPAEEAPVDETAGTTAADAETEVVAETVAEDEVVSSATEEQVTTEREAVVPRISVYPNTKDVLYSQELPICEQRINEYFDKVDNELDIPRLTWAKNVLQKLFASSLSPNGISRISKNIRGLIAVRTSAKWNLANNNPNRLYHPFTWNIGYDTPLGPTYLRLDCRASSIDKSYNDLDQSYPFMDIIFWGNVFDLVVERIQNEGEGKGGLYFDDLFSRPDVYWPLWAKGRIDTVEHYPELISAGLQPNPADDRDQAMWERFKKENPGTAEARFLEYYKSLA